MGRRLPYEETRPEVTLQVVGKLAQSLELLRIT